jgi:hypothetical protein
MKITNSNWTVSYIKENHLLGLINYSPDFQRRYVWSEKQKVYLIDTLLNDFSIPKLYVRQELNVENSTNQYEVIDGQQRLRTIMMFINNEFALLRKKHPKPEFFNSDLEGKTFNNLSTDDKRKILNYTMSVDLVEGSHDEITEMFLRLNLSNTTLNQQEILNSQYFGDFKNLVSRISDEFLDQFGEDKILSTSSVRRMGDHQFITSCLVSILYGITDKQKKFEKTFQDYDEWDVDEMENVYNQFKKIYNLITIHIFEEDIKTTRFKGLNQFISLFEFFHDMIFKKGFSLQKENYPYILDNLMWIEKNMRMDGEGIGKEWFDSSQQGGDTSSMRHIRKRILENLLSEFFNTKDPKRRFTEEDRLIMWNSGDRVCQICQKLVESYNDYDLDHILPHDRGGRTTLKNSRVTHSSCNRSRGKNL